VREKNGLCSGFTDFEYDAFQHLDLRQRAGWRPGVPRGQDGKKRRSICSGSVTFEQEYFSPKSANGATSLTRRAEKSGLRE